MGNKAKEVAATSAASVTIRMVKDDEKKNSVVYRPETESPQNPVQSMYVTRSAYPNGMPAALNVTFEAE